ncbi:thiolase family protein, partial [Corynebacterium sp. 11254D000AR]
MPKSTAHDVSDANDADIVICSPLRTPVGRFGGALAAVPVQDLASTVVRALVERTGLRTADVDDLILGQAAPNGAYLLATGGWRELKAFSLRTWGWMA